MHNHKKYALATIGKKGPFSCTPATHKYKTVQLLTCHLPHTYFDLTKTKQEKQSLFLDSHSKPFRKKLQLGELLKLGPRSHQERNMAPRVRPATTLMVILTIAFVFQLLAILSVPISKNIYLSQYQGYKFGVFGLCNGDTCSKVMVGYSTTDIDDIKGFSLPSNARHSVSKLLVVHPIATGFTFVLFVGSIVLHWREFSSSLRFLFFMLLWTIPTFLLVLLSFLVDILLFVPYLDWGGWIVLASAVLVSLSAILLCIMRRTVSSRKNMKNIGRANTFDNDYQMRPLNYGVGTINDLRSGSDDDDEGKPFAHDNYDTSYFNDDVQHTQTNEDLNNFPSTQPFNTMKDEVSSPHPSHYDNTNVLAPLTSAYRGYEDSNRSSGQRIYDYNNPAPQDANQLISPIAPYEETIQPSAPPMDEFVGAPYPTGDLMNVSNAPYPTTEPYILDSSSISKPSGPRPMPGSSVDLRNIGGDLDVDGDDKSVVPLARGHTNSEFEFEQVDNNKNDVEVDRQLTFRTKIAQTLDQLQPAAIYSNSSFDETDENLLGIKDKTKSGLCEMIDYDTTEDSTDDSTEINDTEDRELESEMNPAVPVQFTASSSVYSSRMPSELPTPINESFAVNDHIAGQQPQQRSSHTNFVSIPEGLAVHSMGSSTDHVDEYILPDANERRTTPAPSFTNESILSSTFTSVSQREVNPKYLEKNNPEEYRRYLQRQLQQKGAETFVQRHSGGNESKGSAADLLIASNPDFALSVSSKRGKR